MPTPLKQSDSRRAMLARSLAAVVGMPLALSAIGTRAASPDGYPSNYDSIIAAALETRTSDIHLQPEREQLTLFR